jgi:hypothetical protein
MSRGEVRLPNPAEPQEPPKIFNFDNVFDSGSALQPPAEAKNGAILFSIRATQQLVFEQCANDIVQACLDGYNGAVAARPPSK